jgi:hypothetical protein
MRVCKISNSRPQGSQTAFQTAASRPLPLCCRNTTVQWHRGSSAFGEWKRKHQSSRPVLALPPASMTLLKGSEIWVLQRNSSCQFASCLCASTCSWIAPMLYLSPFDVRFCPRQCLKMDSGKLGSHSSQDVWGVGVREGVGERGEKWPKHCMHIWIK